MEVHSAVQWLARVQSQCRCVRTEAMPVFMFSFLKILGFPLDVRHIPSARTDFYVSLLRPKPCLNSYSQKANSQFSNVYLSQ